MIGSLSKAVPSGVILLMDGISPPQVGVQSAAVHKVSDMIDALEPRPFKIVEGEPYVSIGIIQLSGAFSGSPSRPVIGQRPCYFCAIHTITARVGAGIRGIMDLGAGNGLCDDLCEFPDLKILFGDSHIKGLAVDTVPGSRQCRTKGTADIFNMYDRTPGAAIALQEDTTRCESPGHEIVEHQIETQPG